MGVSKNNGTPKWMVCKENPIKMDDLGGYHYFWKHPYIFGHFEGIPFVNHHHLGDFLEPVGCLVGNILCPYKFQFS